MRLSALSFLILLPIFSVGQKIKPERVSKLHSQINQSSGLVTADSNFLWTMNDGGGRNELFLLSVTGELRKVVVITHAINYDWEDLASDSAFIYIGDFGNNKNQRRNLVIYKIPYRIASGDSAHFIPQNISFKYPDQKQFPPQPSNWNFDCEAFLHHHDSLYLFSKNVSNPNDGYTRIYRLPDQPGDYIAELIDSFYLHEPVTAADISPDGKTIVLLTYFSLWVFKDFPGHNFFAGRVFQFPFKGLTQKEAICFANGHELFMTDERRFGKGGKLYKIDLNQLDFSRATSKYKKQPFKRAIYNAFNNPKVRYKRIMKRQAAQ